jgi:hypothetical protein
VASVASDKSPKKKRRRNRRSKRPKPPPLTFEDFTREEKHGDRRHWGSYVQMDAAKKAIPYVGKTPDLVRKGLCKRTRRFKGDISPVWFVDNGFGCDRDAQQYEWRMQHEYKPRAKFVQSFGGATARNLRDQETDRIRVPAQTKPSANLDKALRALCSMLQVTQWTTGAIPIATHGARLYPILSYTGSGPIPSATATTSNASIPPSVCATSLTARSTTSKAPRTFAE